MNAFPKNGKSDKARSWIIRFVKFNLVGFTVFLVGTTIYLALFDQLGSWTWLIANGVGGVMQFSLISYLNKKKIGKMFDACHE